MTVTYKNKSRSSAEPEGAVRIGSVRTYLDALEKIKRDRDFILLFRGHSNFSYKLSPRVYRNHGWIENEDVLFKELILHCPTDFQYQESTFQTLVKMQHYSLPTRLLDLTANPLAALYFACGRGKASREAGEVVILRIPKIEVKYFDSDTVSVIANISRRPHSFSLPEHDLSLKEFNEQPQIRYLLHEIKKEKPYFEPNIVRHHLESVVCVKPKLDNAKDYKAGGSFPFVRNQFLESEPG